MRRRVWWGGAWVATAAVVVALVGTGTVQVPTADVTPTPTPTVTVTATPTPTATDTPTPTATPSGECDRTATTGTLATQVSAATAGETICLAAGTYSWSGASKTAPGITLTPADGAAVTMSLSFSLSGVQNVTVDGTAGGGSLTVSSVSMTGSTTTARNITVRNATFTGVAVIDGPTNSNILLENTVHNNSSRNVSCTDTPARIHLSYSAAGGSGVTVRGATMIGGNRDGVQTGTGLTIEESTFGEITENAPDDCQHTDPIQGVGATGMIVRRNTIYDSADGIVDFDNTSQHTITDNVCWGIARGACITLYSDNGSTVEHNTHRGSGVVLELDKKPAHDNGVNTISRNNVGATSANSSTLEINSNNLFSGASAPNIPGTPTFVGGGSPTTWEGHCLSALSAGFTGSTTGGPVGVRCP